MALFDEIISNHNKICYRVDVKRRIFDGGFESEWQPLSDYQRYDLPRRQQSTSWDVPDLQRRPYYTNLINVSPVSLHANDDDKLIYKFDVGRFNFTLKNKRGYYNHVDDVDSFFFGSLSIHMTQVRFVAFYIGKNSEGKFDFANKLDEVTLFEGFIQDVSYDTKDRAMFTCFSYLQLLDKYVKEELEIENYVRLYDPDDESQRDIPREEATIITVNELFKAIRKLPLPNLYGVTYDFDNVTGIDITDQLYFNRLSNKVGSILRDICFAYNKVPSFTYGNFRNIVLQEREAVSRMVNGQPLTLPIDLIKSIDKVSIDGRERVRTAFSDGNVVLRTRDELIINKYIDDARDVDIGYWVAPQIRANILRSLIDYWGVERTRFEITVRSLTMDYYRLFDLIDFYFVFLSEQDSLVRWEDDGNPRTNLTWNNFQWVGKLLSLSIPQGEYMITNITHDLKKLETKLVLELNI